MKILSCIRSLKTWWSTWGCLPVLSWVRAAESYRNGNYAEACEHYQQGLARHPSHPASGCARIDLSFCHFKLGNFKEAEALLKEVIARDPSHRDAYVRLTQLHLWIGMSLEAAWTSRRGLKNFPHDPELVALFSRAVLDNGGPVYLIQESVKELKGLSSAGTQGHRLQVSRARLLLEQGLRDEGTEMLRDLANMSTTTLEAVMYYGERLLHQGNHVEAREYLQRALAVSPDHPRILSLLAETYLGDGPHASPEFAVQLATRSCQASHWGSPRDMHILAEAHRLQGDKMAALLVASRARDMGSRLMGSYREVRSLDQLIESLSSGTLA